MRRRYQGEHEANEDVQLHRSEFEGGLRTTSWNAIDDREWTRIDERIPRNDQVFSSQIEKGRRENTPHMFALEASQSKGREVAIERARLPEADQVR